MEYIDTIQTNWSELPNELLNLISKRIDNEIDLIRFRSICTNWRSSSISNHHRGMLTINFPLLLSPLNNDSININRKLCRLYKHSCFLIKQTPGLRSWIVQITQNSTGQTQFHHPLLRGISLYEYVHHCPIPLSLESLWDLNDPHTQSVDLRKNHLPSLDYPHIRLTFHQLGGFLA